METGGPPDLTAEQTAGCSSVRDPVSNTKVGRNEERHFEVWPLVDMWGESPFPQGLLATSLWGQGAEAMTENPAQPVSTVKTALQETASANLLNFTPECRE